MTILVPIKRVIDPYAKVRPLPDGSGIDAMGAKNEINPFDEIAMEEAVRIRERMGQAMIVAISIGPETCEEQLRKALAMGADQAVLIVTDQPLDSLGVATELAAYVAELKPDLVLMGKQATDGDSGQAAQMLAAKLNWPQICFVSSVEIIDGCVRANRETDDGDETLEASLPCVVTADLRLNEPRYIALPGIIKARTKPLERRNPAASREPKVRTLSIASPPERAAGRKLGSTEELVAEIKALGLGS